MKPNKVWFPQLGKYVEVSYKPFKCQAWESLQNTHKSSYWSNFNVFEFLFRLVVFLFVFLPLSYFCLAVYFGMFGAKWGFIIIGVAYCLIIACILSNTKPTQFIPTVGMIIQGTALLPFLFIGGFILGQAPFGSSTIAGIGASLVSASPPGSKSHDN